VAENPSEAARWYQKAADQGNADAQNALGQLYAKGVGVREDFVQAHKWFNIAAAAGNELARRNRDAMGEKMTPQQLADAQRQARLFRPRRF